MTEINKPELKSSGVLKDTELDKVSGGFGTVPEEIFNSMMHDFDSAYSKPEDTLRNVPECRLSAEDYIKLSKKDYDSFTPDFEPKE